MFEAQFPNSPDDLLAPDFAFLAKAEKLAIPGIPDDLLRAEDLSISLVKNTGPNSSVAEATISGSVEFLRGFGAGVTGELSGELSLDPAAGIYGQLQMGLDSEEEDVVFTTCQEELSAGHLGCACAC